MSDRQEEINVLSDRLRESHRKLMEAVAEILHPVDALNFPNPYDEDLLVERRDTTELGELRRRLYVAERHGFVKLAAMWRRLIQELESGGR